jgi:hypothetical protein
MQPYTLNLVQCPDDHFVMTLKPLIYLASPYSSKDPVIVANRVSATATALARLIEQGNLVFSPIIHSHPIADIVSFSALNHEDGELSGWMAFDFAFIDKCDEVWVLQLEGWEQSRGVTAEIEYAERTGKPVRYIQA